MQNNRLISSAFGSACTGNRSKVLIRFILTVTLISSVRTHTPIHQKAFFALSENAKTHRPSERITCEIKKNMKSLGIR